MIVILLVLSGLFYTTIFVEKVAAQNFTYQFVLTDNTINLDFFKIIDFPTANPTLGVANSIDLSNSTTLTSTVTPTEPPTPTGFAPTDSQFPAPTLGPAASAQILSFDYKMTNNQDLPADLPLFIVTFGQEVIFAATTDSADGLFHQVQLDLKLFDTDYLGKVPIFYQNNYISDLTLSLNNLTFSDQSLERTEELAQIQNLSAIREIDQSLTIVFSLQEATKNHRLYQLFCLDEEQEITHFAKLVQTDNFLWPNFTFLSFLSNQKNELIFHLDEFACEGLVYVADSFGTKSEKVSIVNVKDL
jgi:hypothetical protein